LKPFTDSVGAAVYDRPQNKKAPQTAGLLRWLATVTFSFWSPSSLLEPSFLLPFLISPPILSLYNYCSPLNRVSSLFKNIFKTCHLKIQSKNRARAFFINLSIGYHLTFFYETQTSTISY
jgi:hypothetical protein